MADPQTQDQQPEGLPPGAIVKSFQSPKYNQTEVAPKIEGLPSGAIVREFSHMQSPDWNVVPGRPETSRGPELGPGSTRYVPFIDRFLTSMGIPKDSAEWHDLTNTITKETFGQGHVGGLAQATLENYFKGVKGASKESTPEMVRAVRNIHEGKPVGPELYRIASGYGNILAAGTPVIGPIVQHIYQDAYGENYSGALGGTLGLAGNVAMLFFGRPYTDAQKVDKLAFATDISGNAVDYVEAYKNVLPDLERTAQKVGRANMVGDLEKIVRESKQNINNEFSLALQPIANQPVVTTQISDTIENVIRSRPNLIQTPEGRAFIKELRSRAKPYRAPNKPWTMRALDQERMDANARLRNFYNKSDVSGKIAAMRIEADEIVDNAVVQGAKDIVYPAMDRANGKPAGFYANLKQRQSNLIDITDRLDKRVKELNNTTASRKGTPILSRGNVSTYGHPESGRLGLSIHRLQDVLRSPEKAADVSVKRAFKGTSRAKQAAAVMTYSLPVRALIHENEGYKTLDDLEKILKDRK